MNRRESLRPKLCLLCAVLVLAITPARCINVYVTVPAATPSDSNAATDSGRTPTRDASRPEHAGQHGEVDLRGEPNAKTLTISSGFVPDPSTVRVQTGGKQDASKLDSSCTGHIHRRPDVRLSYTASTYPLNIYAVAGLDTTLVVNLPDGRWLCSDDYEGHNPAVLLNNPQSGLYNIWVGSFDGTRGEAILHVSERPPKFGRSSSPRTREVKQKGDLTRTPDVIFVPTPQAAVERMLEIAAIRKGDVLYDLGCGDGRIVVTAAKKYGIRAVGFDIDPERIKEARENVRKAGVGKLVTIRHADIFTVDLSKASVVTLYLLPRLNVALMPQLRKMKPGSRIISFDFDMRGAKPHTVVRDSFGGPGMRTIYKWIVPWKEEPDS